METSVHNHGGNFAPQFKAIRYSQGRDFKSTRWYSESLEQDAITGEWDHRRNMVLIDGEWRTRDNVDEEDLLREGR